MTSSETKCFINRKKIVSLYGTGGNFLSVLIEKMEKECYNMHRNQCILYNGEYANGKLQ